MSHIIYDINDRDQLHNELRLTNEYAEYLEKRVAYLEDRLEYECDPSRYNQRRGHAPDCIRVKAPRSLFSCDCGFVKKP